MRSLWVEAYVLEGQPTGVGRFLGNLLAEWRRSGCPWEIRLLGRDRLAAAWQTLESAFPRIPLHTKSSSFLFWQQGVVRRWLQKQNPAGVYFGPNYTLPLGVPQPRVLVFHDASFFRHPEWFDWRMRWFKCRVIRRSVREADLVLVPSEFTRRELLDLHGGIAPEKIVVVPEGWDPRFRQPPPIPQGELRGRYGLPSEAPVVLSVGSVFHRRRMDILLRAWGEMRQGATGPVPRLVVLGANRTHPFVDYRRIIEAEGLGGLVSWLDYAEEDVLHSFYHAADAVVYLSEYEGFGLPVLEGLAAGKPVIVSDIPVFRELYGEAVYRTPLRSEALVATLRDVLRERRQPPGARDVLKRFDWSRAAAVAREALDEVFRRRRLGAGSSVV
jgi:alpha-1,3-rhamnosyl/mannosyltransferase